MSVEFENGQPVLPPEPIEWRTRPLWAAARLWCGATTFFFVAFLFAYVYLRSLDTNHGWKIGQVHVPGGFGVAIAVLFVLSGIAYRVGHRRPQQAVSLGALAIGLAVIAIVLQFIEYTGLDFGGASGGYASVFIGWTITYTLGAIASLYWLETQVATYWRAHKDEVDDDQELIMRAGIEASSFYWAYYVAWGAAAYIMLYLV
jgi:heme/copper-type cytochrome/quinol oxidase subunit 3